MTPAQTYLKRFAVSVAGMYGITPGELCTSSKEGAIEARRIVMVVGRDVLRLGPTQTAETLGTSKSLVRHHLHEMGKMLLKNRPLRSVVKATKERAREGFEVYCEGLLTKGAAE